MNLKYLETSADISADGLHRYWLSRRLSMGERTIAFVGYNPSTADGLKDDPTIRREVGFSRLWGYDWFLKGNLYAYRSTDPKALRWLDDLTAVGPRNQEALKWIAQRAEVIVAAWGSLPLTRYADQLAQWILTFPHTRCLGQNQNGAPKHPLYLPQSTTLQKAWQ